MSAAFSYQGRLNDQGSLANGTYDLRLSLFGSPRGGSAAAGPLTNSAVAVTGGVFTVVLDFGAGVFDGTSYWLEVAARTNGGGGFTTLSPRQPLLAAPYAAYAPNAGAAVTAGTANSVPAASISGIIGLAQLPGGVLTNNAAGVNLSGAFSGDGGGMTNLNANSITGDFSGATFRMPIVGWQPTNGTTELVGNSSYQALYGGGFAEASSNTFWLTNIQCVIGGVSGATQAVMKVFQRADFSSSAFNFWTLQTAPAPGGMVTTALYTNTVALPAWSTTPVNFPIPPATALIASTGVVVVVFLAAQTNTHAIQFANWSMDSGNTNLPRQRMPYILNTNGAVYPGDTLYDYGSAGLVLSGYVVQPVTNLSTYIASLAAQASAVGITNAALLPYNGSSSGLTSGNVQGAIDEVASNTAAWINSQAPRIVLPDEFAAVVGDKLQLFVRGMIEAQNPYWAPYEIVCSKGAQYPRYFEYTPQAGDPASQTLTVNLLNLQGIGSATAQTTLRVVSANRAPSSNVCVLSIGDSLTVGGNWPAEFYRRLTQSGGSPAGLGFGNIAFIGDHPMGSYAGQSFMGYGGWAWSTYISTATNSAVWVAAAGHDKTSADAGSTWGDSTGQLWTLMSVNATSIKLGNYGGAGGRALPAQSGTLTNVAGTGAAHTNAITFTAASPTVQSPLSDGTNFSFRSFCAAAGYPYVSVCYVLLGWNDLLGGAGNAAYATNNAAITTAAQTFISQLNADYPGALIRVVGLEVPSPSGGLGANYGAIGGYASYYKLLRSVNGLNLAYQQLCANAANSAFCRFINLSCQFDSEYNMPSVLTPVNSRNSTTEARGSNGVHPETAGYNQIADAVWRDFVRTFCQ